MTEPGTATHAVIFEVRPSDAGRDEYLAIAASLRPLLDEIDGFVSIERFASRSRPGWILSLSFWADEAAVAAWRSRERHHQAQVKGRDGVFQDYRLRVAYVHSDDGAERSSTYNDPARRSIRYAAIVETGGHLSSALLTAMVMRGMLDAVDEYDSLTTPGKSAYLVSFPDAASMRAWRTSMAAVDPGLHHRRVRTVEVVRDYGMFDRAQAPQYYPDARRAGVMAQ